MGAQIVPSGGELLLPERFGIIGAGAPHCCSKRDGMVMSPECDPQQRRAIADELDRIVEDSTYTAKGHFRASGFLERVNLCLGLGSTVIGAASGFIALSSIPNHATVAGVGALVASTLASVLTFLNPSQKAAAHLQAGNALNSVRDSARQVQTIDLVDGSVRSLRSRLDSLSERKNEINAGAPKVPDRAYRQAQRGIESGEALNRIDKEAQWERGH